MTEALSQTGFHRLLGEIKRKYYSTTPFLPKILQVVSGTVTHFQTAYIQSTQRAYPGLTRHFGLASRYVAKSALW